MRDCADNEMAHVVLARPNGCVPNVRRGPAVRLGSSGLMMEFALDQKTKLGRDYTLLRYELDRESSDSLAALSEQYRKRWTERSA